MHAPPQWRNMYLVITFSAQTKSCTWNEPYLFVKHASLLSFWEIQTFNFFLSRVGYCYTIFGAHSVCPSKRMFVFDDRNVHKYFTVLNFTIICIKTFICNNTIFSFSFLNEILFLFVFLNTTPSVTFLWNLIEHWLTDFASIHVWYSFANASIL